MTQRIIIVQSLSHGHVWLSAAPWIVAWQAFLSFTISRSLVKFMSIESVMSSNHLVLCCLLLSLYYYCIKSLLSNFNHHFVHMSTYTHIHTLPLCSSKLERKVQYISWTMKVICYISRFLLIYLHISSVQLLSRVWLFVTPWTAAHQASLSVTNSRSLSKPMSIESVMLSSHLILCLPLLLLPSIFPSIRIFSNELALCITWPKYWSFSFNISPSNEHPGLISFRMDWFNLLAVQGTLKSLLRHHSSKASFLRRSAFFRVQLSHPYMTPGKS